MAKFMITQTIAIQISGLPTYLLAVFRHNKDYRIDASLRSAIQCRWSLR